MYRGGPLSNPWDARRSPFHPRYARSPRLSPCNPRANRTLMRSDYTQRATATSEAGPFGFHFPQSESSGARLSRLYQASVMTNTLSRKYIRFMCMCIDPVLIYVLPVSLPNPCLRTLIRLVRQCFRTHNKHCLSLFIHLTILDRK